MFHPAGRFRCQLFHFNKFINDKCLRSNWQRLSTIYASQFSAIQSRNGSPCIIRSKNQEFYQRNQFCSGNDDGNQIQKDQPQHSQRTEKRQPPDGHLILETQMLGLNEINNKFLMLKFEKGKSGNKFLIINKINKFAQFSGYPKIPVPEDAYAFVRALDELAELATENFEQKLLQIRDPQSTDEVGNKLKSEMKLKSVEFVGLFHKYQLFLFINNDRGGINQGEICLRLFAVHKKLATDDRMIFPLHALPWLRRQMAEMLAKHDGTEEIEKAPAQIPQKFFPKNFIQMQQKGMQSKIQNSNQIDDIENANSSSIPINNLINEKEELQRSERIEKRKVENELVLETRLLGLNKNKTKYLLLKLEKGKSGQKFFNIILNRNGQYNNFPKILVPEDAYAFVRALDELILELAAENFEQKLQKQDTQLVIKISKDGQKPNQAFLLKIVELLGIVRKFKFELLFFRNTGREFLENEISFRICAVNKNTGHQFGMIFPLHVLLWFRKQMAEMLAKHDGTESIETEAPAQIPKHFLHINSDLQIRRQKGMQSKIQNSNQIGDIENANSSSIISSPETPTNNNLIKQKENLEEREKRIDEYSVLDTKFLQLDFYNRRQLRLKLEKGESGQKFFHISFFVSGKGRYINFAKILVPEDAYLFVRALDELIGEMAAENFQQKLKTLDNSKSTNEIANDGRKIAAARAFKLRTVEVIGQHHNFQLELLFFPNEHQKYGKKQICLQLFAIRQIIPYEHLLILPLEALPWLRTQMAEMLAKYDGREAIALEAPAQIPQKFFQKNVSRTSTLRNDVNSSGQKLQQKGMRPQSINKKSKNFQKNSKKMSAKMQNSNQIGDIKNANLSSTILSPKMPTANKKKGQDVENDLINDEVDDDELLMDPLVAASGRKMCPLFDFEEDYEEKYRRLAAKRDIPFRY